MSTKVSIHRASRVYRFVRYMHTANVLVYFVTYLLHCRLTTSGVTGSACWRAEFTRERYCACATYLLVELVNVAHLRWAQITKQAYFTKA